MIQLLDAWQRIAMFMDVYDLMRMEIASKRFKDLYSGAAFRARREDDEISYMTFKTQYEFKNSFEKEKPLSDKQHCINALCKKSFSYVCTGGGYGHADSSTYVFDVPEVTYRYLEGLEIHGGGGDDDDDLQQKDDHAPRSGPMCSDIGHLIPCRKEVPPLAYSAEFRDPPGCSAATQDAYGMIQTFGGTFERLSVNTSQVARLCATFTTTRNRNRIGYDLNCRIFTDQALLRMPAALSYAAAATLKDGSILVTGGGAGPYRGAEVYNTCYYKAHSLSRVFDTARGWSRFLESSDPEQMFVLDSSDNESGCGHSLPLLSSLFPAGYNLFEELRQHGYQKPDAPVPLHFTEVVMNNFYDNMDIIEDIEDSESMYLPPSSSLITHHYTEMVRHSQFTRNFKALEKVVWGEGKIPNMKAKRCGHSLLATMDDKVVAIGGYGGDVQYHKSVEVLDVLSPDAGWHSTASMKFARSGAAAAVGMGGLVLVAGGSSDGENSLKALESFDPREGVWRREGDMHRRRGYCTGTMGPSGRFLVSGGMGEGALDISNSLEIYDQRKGVWSLIEPCLEDWDEAKVDGEPIEDAFFRSCHHMFHLPATLRDPALFPGSI